MNRFKFKAFVSEFPFLCQIVRDKIPDTIKVKRADENLLKRTPAYYRHDGSMGITVNIEDVHFVTDDDSVILDAVMKEGRTSSNYSHSQDRSWEGESILEAIDRHNLKDTIKYIVVDNYHLNDWPGSEYVNTWEITIYKTSKNTSFATEIQKASATAVAEVRAEADF